MDECRQIAALITSYVDEELPVTGRADVERHVGVCPPCRRRLMGERSARAALRQCAERLSPSLPPGLETRCRASAHEQTRALIRPVASGGWRRLAPAGVFMVLLVALGVGALPFVTGHSSAVLAAQLTADHVKCFAVVMPREVTGSDVDAAERRLASYGWQVHVPPSAPAEGLRLLGVRQCLYAKGQMPHVLYEANGQPLSLFALDGVQRPPATLTSFGHACRIWQRDGRTFVLVGPKDAGPMLTRIAEYVEREAR